MMVVSDFRVESVGRHLSRWPRKRISPLTTYSNYLVSKHQWYQTCYLWHSPTFKSAIFKDGGR